MTKNLRKRHLQIWLLWAILFPVAILMAWISIPPSIPEKFVQKEQAETLPLVIREWDREDYLVQLQTDEQRSVYQVLWKNKTVLTYPTATIYFSSKIPFQVENSAFVGRIEARGTYHFPLDSTHKQWIETAENIVLYDFIHQQIIDTLKFKQ